MELMTDNISLDQVRADGDYDLVNLYDNTTADDEYPNDSPFQYNSSNCEYYEPDKFSEITSTLNDYTSYFHLNCRGLSSNWESFHELLCELHGDHFSYDVIGVSEVYRCDNDSRLFLPGYHELITKCRDDGFRGGVGIFIKENINYKLREDLSVFIPHIFESIFIEIEIGVSSCKSCIIGVVYRPNTAPRADLDVFSNTLFEIMNIINNEHKNGIIMGDMNIDLLKFNTHNKTSEYLDDIFSHGFLPVIHKPTRICHSSATLIDHIYTNNITSRGLSGIITTDVADHFGIFHSVKLKTNITQKKHTKTRKMSSTNINTFKTHLAHTDFSTVLSNDCPNVAYEEFMKKYYNVFEISFPLRAVKPNKKFIKREPWVTPALLTSSRNKAKLFAKKIRNPNDNNIAYF